MNRALFLDRDGIVDHLVQYADTGEWESPRRVADLQMISDAVEPLRKIAAAGWLLVVVTNQPSHAKGKVSKESLEQVHAEVLRRLKAGAVPIAASYVCFHHPEGIVQQLAVSCDCRKPATGSLLRAAGELEIDLGRSWMVGDQDSDLLCGRAAGCQVALIEHEGSAAKRGKVQPDVRCANLDELANLLLAAR